MALLPFAFDSGMNAAISDQYQHQDPAGNYQFLVTFLKEGRAVCICDKVKFSLFPVFPHQHARVL
jgi:hypothetical protein